MEGVVVYDGEGSTVQRDREKQRERMESNGKAKKGKELRMNRRKERDGGKTKMKQTIWVSGCERKMEERRNERRWEKVEGSNSAVRCLQGARIEER